MAKPRKATKSDARLSTSIRLDKEQTDRLDAIAAADEASLGFRPTTADTLRGCLALGIVAREEQLGIKPVRGKK